MVCGVYVPPMGGKRMESAARKMSVPVIVRVIVERDCGVARCRCRCTCWGFSSDPFSMKSFVSKRGLAATFPIPFNWIFNSGLNTQLT